MGRVVPTKRAVDVREVEANGEVILHDASGGQIVVLSPVAAAIFELIDGQRDVEAIVDVLVASVEVSRDAARRDVEAFVRDLETRGIVAIDAP